MSKLKLTYFDFSGGRGETARLAFHLGGITFEDSRFPMSEFLTVRKSTPLGQVPTLEIDGELICQSNAINRYIGQHAKLYPSDFIQALYCDEVMDGVEDILTKIVATFQLQGDELKTAREKLVEGAIPQYLQWLSARLEAHGGQYFADNQLTIADLKTAIWVRSLNAGVLDHIPTDLVQNVAPQLQQHFQRVMQLPKIVEYYA